MDFQKFIQISFRRNELIRTEELVSGDGERRFNILSTTELSHIDFLIKGNVIPRLEEVVQESKGDYSYCFEAIVTRATTSGYIKELGIIHQICLTCDFATKEVCFRSLTSHEVLFFIKKETLERMVKRAKQELGYL